MLLGCWMVFQSLKMVSWAYRTYTFYLLINSFWYFVWLKSNSFRHIRKAKDKQKHTKALLQAWRPWDIWNKLSMQAAERGWGVIPTVWPAIRSIVPMYPYSNENSRHQSLVISMQQCFVYCHTSQCWQDDSLWLCREAGAGKWTLLCFTLYITAFGEFYQYHFCYSKTIR